jgi:hypothetical protein
VGYGPPKAYPNTACAAAGGSSFGMFKHASWEQADVICIDPDPEYGTAAAVLCEESVPSGRTPASGRLQLTHCNVGVLA